MCTTISGNSYIGKILSKEFNGKTEISSSDLYNLDKNKDHKADLDTDQDGKVSANELKTFLKQEGLLQKPTTLKGKVALEKDLESEARSLTELIQKGGSLVKHDSDPKNITFELKVNQQEQAPDLEKVKSEEETDNQPVLKLGQLGDAIQKLQILLNKLDVGFKFNHVGKTFDQRTEEAVKTYQRNNSLPETGIVDKKTLTSMEEATKLDSREVYIEGKVNPATGIKVPDTDRVKALVATQLSNMGINTDKAFDVGEKLVESQHIQDKRMGSEHKCYTAVKNALEDALNLPYERFAVKKGNRGDWARTAGTNMLSKHPELFKEIKGLDRDDLKSLPAGAIIVYKPLAANKPGHIGVQNGQGKDISDKERIQENVHKTAAFEVYFPVDILPEPAKKK
jgi:hypothetical protein